MILACEFATGFSTPVQDEEGRSMKNGRFLVVFGPGELDFDEEGGDGGGGGFFWVKFGGNLEVLGGCGICWCTGVGIP